MKVGNQNKKHSKNLVAPVQHRCILARRSSLQKIGRWRGSEYRPLRRCCCRTGNAVIMVKIAFFAELLFILIIIIVLALGAFVVVVQMIIAFGQTFTTPLSLHTPAQSFEMLTLSSPSLELLLVTSALFCHFENVAVGLFMLAIERMILLLQALGLLGHLFHLLPERQEQFVTIVQGILDLGTL